jgi:hypothetical protein
LVTEEFLRGARDQEVIRIADEVDFVLPLLRCGGEAFRQQPLQSIQGPVRQDGGNHAPNNVAKSSLIPDSIITRAQLRPKYGQGWQPRLGAQSRQGDIRDLGKEESP